MATHSSTLAWKIPWMEEPGRLQSMGSQRVGHNSVTSLHFTWSHLNTTGEIIHCSTDDDEYVWLEIEISFSYACHISENSNCEKELNMEKIKELEEKYRYLYIYNLAIGKAYLSKNSPKEAINRNYKPLINLID